MNSELERIPDFVASRLVHSAVPGIAKAQFDANAVADPYELETLDFAIALGQFSVAENGAVWVSEAGLRHRAVLFIAQHMVLLLPADAIVDNMHEAYERLSFETAGFGTFISGPSKTADIEQSLVIGAHGPRSLIVFCVELLPSLT